MKALEYKLAAFDMDGTLLKKDGSLHPDTIRDLQAAAEQGMELVYCSGRAIPEITMYQEELPFFRYAIACSGAILYDLKEKKCLFRKGIEQKDVLSIIHIAKGMGAMVQLLSETESAAEAKDICHMKDFLAGNLQPLFEEIAVKVDDIEREAKEYDSLPKINAFFPSPEKRAEALEIIKKLPVQCYFSAVSQLEMTAQNISKEKGLAILAGYLDIPLKETIAFGDSFNDQRVLETAGFAVAMENAVPQIREICDLVTDDNDHNGVGKALVRLADHNAG